MRVVAGATGYRHRPGRGEEGASGAAARRRVRSSREPTAPTWRATSALTRRPALNSPYAPAWKNRPRQTPSGPLRVRSNHPDT